MPRPITGRTTPNLTDEERAKILDLAEHNYTVAQIADEIGRTPQPIYRFLATIKPTGKLARAYFDAKALQLSKRVVKDATVEESLEVLDRLDVLPAKRDKGGGGPSVIVCVGMPGAPALQPPMQDEIERAIVVRALPAGDV